MNERALIEEVAAWLFANTVDMDDDSEAIIEMKAKEAWRIALIFANVRPSVGRQPIASIPDPDPTGV